MFGSPNSIEYGFHPSHGVGFMLNQILVGYSQEICATVVLAYLESWHQRKSKGVGALFLLLFLAACRMHSSTYEAQMCVWKLNVVTTLTFPYKERFLEVSVLFVISYIFPNVFSCFSEKCNYNVTKYIIDYKELLKCYTHLTISIQSIQ